MRDDLDHKEYLLQKYELKVYHYEKYLLKKGQLENEARQLLTHFRIELPARDQPQRVSNTVSDNIALRKQLAELKAELEKIKEVRDQDKQIIADLNFKIENLRLAEKTEKAAAKPIEADKNDKAAAESDFFQMHQLRMLPSLKLSLISNDDINTIIASGWTNDQLRRESITATNPTPAGIRRDTIKEIVQSFN